MTGAPRPPILVGMSPAETAGLSVADVIAHVSALGSTIAALGIWFFGFVMWGQNRSRAAQAARDAKATQAILDALRDALKDAAEDRKAMREQAAEDRKVMREQAAEDRKAMQERAAEERKAMQEQAAEDRKAMQEQAAEDRKAMQEQATEDRKAMQEQAAEERKAMQEQAAEERKAMQEQAAEEREKTFGLQIQALETLVTLAKSPDDSRGPAKWGGPSQTDPAE